MRYVKFEYGTGYCGMGGYEYYAIPEDRFEEKILDDFAWELALDNGQSFYDPERLGLIYPEEDYDSRAEYEEALEQAEEDWLSGLWGHWEEITKGEWEENEGIEY